MTKDEFLAALKLTPRDWFITKENLIRRRREETFDRQCPISSLDNKTAGYYKEVAESLGLDKDLTTDIIDAADDFHNESVHNESHRDYILQLRGEILIACGLSIGNRKG